MFHKASLRRAGMDIITIKDIPRVEGSENTLESLICWKDEQYQKQLSTASQRGQPALGRMGYVPCGDPPPFGTASGRRLTEPAARSVRSTAGCTTPILSRWYGRRGRCVWLT